MKYEVQLYDRVWQMWSFVSSHNTQFGAAQAARSYAKAVKGKTRVTQTQTQTKVN